MELQVPLRIPEWGLFRLQKEYRNAGTSYIGAKSGGIYFPGGRYRQPNRKNSKCRCHDGGQPDSQKNSKEYGYFLPGGSAA